MRNNILISSVLVYIVSGGIKGLDWMDTEWLIHPKIASLLNHRWTFQPFHIHYPSYPALSEDQIRFHRPCIVGCRMLSVLRKLSNNIRIYLEWVKSEEREGWTISHITLWQIQRASAPTLSLTWVSSWSVKFTKGAFGDELTMVLIWREGFAFLNRAAFSWRHISRADFARLS